jgi:hypothetical protein
MNNPGAAAVGVTKINVTKNPHKVATFYKLL